MEGEQFKRRRSENRIKKKLGKGVTMEDLLEGWTQCCYLLPNKQRLCNIARLPNSTFCGNHIDSSKDNNQELLRIPCPLDPTHSIYPKNLQAHLKICNAVKNEKEMLELPFYKHNCNGVDPSLYPKPEIVGEIDLSNLLTKVQTAFEKVIMVKLIEKEFTSSKDQEVRDIVGKGQTSFKQLRHVEQDIAIIHQLEDFELISTQENNETKRVYLEFGAGKGLLGLSVHVYDPIASLLFIERSGNRKKVDRLLTERHCDYKRLRMDIRHCYLPQVPIVNEIDSSVSSSTQVAIVAKHLCGVASDLAIRSFVNLPKQERMTRALGIATCCHHACNYVDFTGKQWLTEQGFTPQEFDILIHWSGWASMDRTAEYRKRKAEDIEQQLSKDIGEVEAGEDEEDDEGEDKEQEETNEHKLDAFVFEVPRPKEVTYENMHIVGKQVKRILDYARIQYIQHELQMSKVSFSQYCVDSFSPECMMILAKDQ